MVGLEKSSESTEKEEKSSKRIELHFPIIMLRTRASIELMTQLGRLKPTRFLAWMYVVIFPFLAVSGIYLVASTVLLYISIPAAGEVARETGFLANILIPGLNPYLPLAYGWIALVLAIVVHEGGHGIAARSLGFLVKSAGLIFMLIFPIGAFVEPDEAALKKAKFKDAFRILAAGVGSNIITAVIFLLLMMTIVSSLTPVSQQHGLGVVGVVQDYPAYNAGLKAGDILISINSHFLREFQDLSEVLLNLKPNDQANLTFARNDRIEHKMVLLTSNPSNASKGYLGIQVVDDPELILDSYKNLSNSLSTSIYLITPTILLGPYVIPYSHLLHMFYTSPIGNWFYPLSNLFYWIWFINFNLAIFNSLPIYPLDGGQVLSRMINFVGMGKLKETTTNYITYTVTSVMIFLVLLTLALPYILAS